MSDSKTAKAKELHELVISSKESPQYKTWLGMPQESLPWDANGFPLMPGDIVKFSKTFGASAYDFNGPNIKASVGYFYSHGIAFISDHGETEDKPLQYWRSGLGRDKAEAPLEAIFEIVDGATLSFPDGGKLHWWERPQLPPEERIGWPE